MSKITRSFFALMLGAFILSAGLMSCNSNNDKKDTPKDSTATVKPVDTVKTVAPKDTTKMDTNTVKKMGDKPIHQP